MRNLYKHLGLSPASSASEIKARLPLVSDHELREAARYVLLDPPRRRVYDRNHRELTLIGKLRSDLGLTGTMHWPEETHSSLGEFTFSHSSPTGTKEQSKTKILKRLGNSVLIAVYLAVKFWWLTIILIAVAYVSMCEKSSRIPTRSSVARERTLDPSNPFADLPDARSTARQVNLDDLEREAMASVSTPMQTPETGLLRKWYTGGEAPLTVKTPFQGHHYFLKLVNEDTGQLVFTAFIKSSDTFKTFVPVGRYKLKYATGAVWYGEQQLFGPNTSYNIAGKTLIFRETYDGYEGHTIELILQRDGNLPTHRINASNF